MKQRPFSSSELFLPLALLIASLCGATAQVTELMRAYLILGAASLGSGYALARCSGKLINRGKLVFSSLLALLPVLLAAGAFAWYLLESRLWYATAGILLISDIARHLLHAADDGISTVLSGFLISLILATLLILEKASPHCAVICLSACGGFLLIELIFILLLYIKDRPVPSAALIRELPIALLQKLLLPALFALTLYLQRKSMFELPAENTYLLGCMLLYGLMYSHFPRDREDSSFLIFWSLILLLLAAGFCLCDRRFDIRYSDACLLLAASALGTLMFGPRSLRGYVTALIELVPYALLYCSFEHRLLLPTVALLALLLALPDLPRLLREYRAARFAARRRAMLEAKQNV